MKSKASMTLLVLATLAFCRGAWSGQEFGRASQEELEMTSIPEDPDADAVVLFDFGAVTPHAFARHRRVKVLTKRGTESANVSIPFYKRDKITDLEGCTITRDGRRFWLDSKQVFTKKGKDWNELVFTLPGVEEGCVFEYRYSKRTKYTYVLGPWYFQDRIFTKLSQVTLRLESGWLYSYFFRNAGTAKTEARMVDIYGGMEYVWTFENVPPIREEPYVACLNDYRTAVYFEQSGWRNAYSKNRDPIDTWAELGEMAEKLYQGFKYDESKIKKTASELTKEASSDSAKAENIYDFVRQRIDWNGERGIFNLDEKSFRKILDRMEGTAAEVNFLLLKLLEHAEIKAEVVLISTRDNGTILKLKPGLIQFDHLIVRVRFGDSYWYLDAVERLCPLGVLPQADLGECGLLLDGYSSRIIELPTPRVISRRHIVTTGTVAEDGGFACSSLVSYAGYPDFAVRNRIQEKGREEFVKDEFLNSIPAAVMNHAAVAWLDSTDRPLELSINFSAPQYVQMVAEDWYVNPTLFSGLESNPFESEERQFTVDFNYPFAHTEDTELHVPEGFEIRNSPGAVFRSIPGAEFRKTFSFEENRVKCHRELRVSKLTFPVSQYDEIREFYEQIVSADQLRIVLTRKQ
jgi:hypothetical protein